MLRVSMTLASFRTIIAVDAVVPTIAPIWIRMLISHQTLPFHHSSTLSRGQMRGLMELKKLIMMTQRNNEPEAMLPWRKCQTRGGVHKIQEGKAKTGKRIAER
jgi:hypothetical protein